MDANFDQIDFGPFKPYLEDDDITDISYDNDGQVHLKTLSKGIFRIDNPAINNAFIEKLAFQCSNVMGKTFNMAHPFLDAESTELRLAFIHESVARNGIACVVRKTPAKIRLQKEKIVADKYVELDIVEFLEQCVLGHCNIIVSGETGSGKTELVKYLASKIIESEKIITIEDTLELHLDKIFPHRDIVSMKTNNIASYTDILEACMRQNPKWILLSEVRSAEAVLAVRNSISSGHYILSTIHADKASSIPNRLYSLLESNQDLDQFMSSICRYIQLGIHVRGYTDKATHSFKREIAEVTEFFVNSETNKAGHNVIYRKGADGKVIRNNPSPYLIDYLEVQGVFLPKELQNMAGEDTSSSVVVQDPLSEEDISDDQTVTFNSNGVVIEPKNVNESQINNPIENIGSQSNEQKVSEITVNPNGETNNIYSGLDSGVVQEQNNTNESQINNPIENIGSQSNNQTVSEIMANPNGETNNIYSGLDSGVAQEQNNTNESQINNPIENIGSQSNNQTVSEITINPNGEANNIYSGLDSGVAQEQNNTNESQINNPIENIGSQSNNQPSSNNSNVYMVDNSQTQNYQNVTVSEQPTVNLDNLQDSVNNQIDNLF